MHSNFSLLLSRILCCYEFYSHSFIGWLILHCVDEFYFKYFLSLFLPVMREYLFLWMSPSTVALCVPSAVNQLPSLHLLQTEHKVCCCCCFLCHPSLFSHDTLHSKRRRWAWSGHPIKALVKLSKGGCWDPENLQICFGGKLELTLGISCGLWSPHF